jgi:hypothetical protein
MAVTIPTGSRYTGGGTRTMTGHERMTAQADADVLRDAAGALRDAYDALSETDPRLKQWADTLSEEAADLEELREVRC